MVGRFEVRDMPEPAGALKHAVRLEWLARPFSSAETAPDVAMGSKTMSSNGKQPRHSNFSPFVVQ